MSQCFWCRPFDWKLPTLLIVDFFASKAKIANFGIAILGYQDVASGQITMNFSSLPPAVSQIKGGNLKALAVTGDKRVKSLPDVPTVAVVGPLTVVVVPETTWVTVTEPLPLLPA